MKQFAIILTAVLIGVLGALLLYDLLVLKPRGDALAETLTMTAKVDLANARDEAQGIAENLDAAVDRSVSDAQQAMDAQAQEQERRRLATEAVNRASMFKVAIAETYMSTGQWPANAQAAGLGPPASYAGGAVKGIELGQKGTITIALSDPFAVGSKVQLVPRVDPQSYVVDWRCSLEGDESLPRYLPACQ